MLPPCLLQLLLSLQQPPLQSGLVALQLLHGARSSSGSSGLC
jgi:hypothetical protein